MDRAMHSAETQRRRQPHHLIQVWPEERTSRFSGNGNIRVSFEFFPPKTSAMQDTLWRSIRRLEPLGPTNVSVTYGAGSETRERTHATVARILKETSLDVAAHLTCVSASRNEIDEVARKYWELGVRRIVALRGDPIAGADERFVPAHDGYVNAADLVAGIKAIAPFEITVAAHPEKHPESLSFEADLDALKAKIDAGATSALTQYFFDNTVFFRFLDRARASGIAIPIVPGILPVHNFREIARVAAKSCVGIPDWVVRRFEGLEDDQQTRRFAAAAIAAEQVLDLAEHGITEFHFYTLNRADLIYAICHMLGLRAVEGKAKISEME
jgi:methylenetetrahydrofolate reductase (NADPH)